MQRVLSIHIFIARKWLFCQYTWCHVWILLAFLYSTWPKCPPFCFIFSKHKNVLTTHAAISLYWASYDPCGDLLQQSKSWSIWQLDLMTFRKRASQAQCSPHASPLQHIKHLCALKPLNPLKTVTQMMKWGGGSNNLFKTSFNVSPMSPHGLIT